MKRFFSLILFTAVALGLPLSAQPAGSAAHIQATLTFLPVSLPAPVSVRLAGPPDDPTAGGAPFTLNARIRSKEQSYKGVPRALLLQQPSPGAPWVPLATIDLSAEVKRAIVFLARDQPGPKGELRYRAWVMPEKEAGMSAGETVLFNGTGVPLAVDLAGRQFTASPGAMPAFTTAALGGKVVSLKGAVQTQGSWQKVADGELQFPADKRCFVLILPPLKAKSIVAQVFTVYEDVPPPAPVKPKI